MASLKFRGAALALACIGLAASSHGAVAKEAAAPAPAPSAASASEPYVRPDVKAFLEKLKVGPKMSFTREALAVLRTLPPGAIPSQDLPAGELAVIRDFEMPGPGGPIKLRLFDARAEREPGPVVVFYHGGGFVFGDLDSYAGLTAEMARGLDLPVISVDYRLAPEHRWPAAPDDAEAAARWIAANGAALGLKPTGLVLSGDSAGGNLALITAAALRDKPAALPLVMQIPLYPATDSVGVYPSQTQFAEGFLLSAESMAQFEQHYAADPKSLRTSPLLGNLAGLPPTVLIAASLDPLRDQNRAYAAKLIEAGVPTIYLESQGLIHGFATFRKEIPSAQRDLADMLALAKEMLESSGRAD